MQRDPLPCVLCSRFHRRDDAPPGQGYCEGYERMRRHDDTNEACPLLSRAKDEAARRKWAERQNEKEKN
jgi:hypothetical protein